MLELSGREQQSPTAEFDHFKKLLSLAKTNLPDLQTILTDERNKCATESARVYIAKVDETLERIGDSPSNNDAGGGVSMEDVKAVLIETISAKITIDKQREQLEGLRQAAFEGEMEGGMAGLTRTQMANLISTYLLWKNLSASDERDDD